jgi:hypothetical protein
MKSFSASGTVRSGVAAAAAAILLSWSAAPATADSHAGSHDQASRLGSPPVSAEQGAKVAAPRQTRGEIRPSNYQLCRSRVRNDTPWPIGRPSAPGSSLKMLITHTDVITTSAQQFFDQRAAYRAAGIGPWAKPTQNAFWADYCGRKVLLKRHILLTTNTDETYVRPGESYFEIMRDVSTAPTFFNDFAATHPEGLVYQGMVPANTKMTYQQLVQALNKQKVPILMAWPQPGPKGLTLHTLIVKIGSIYGEVVYVPGIT